jgi:Sporulation and spore germination
VTTAPPRTARCALAALAAAVLGGGCMDGNEVAPPPQPAPPPPAARPPPPTIYARDQFRPVVASACGKRLSQPPRPGRTYVFFGCQRQGMTMLDAAAARELPASAGPRDALRTLLRGPTEEEKAAGFVSTFGPATERIGFDLRRRPGGLVVVDLDRAIAKVEFAFVSRQEVAQITSTVGQFPNVRRVELRVGGQSLCRVAGGC